MTNRLLLTGASGYLGGTILALLKDAKLPPCDVYCLVRNETQANEVKKYGATPVHLDLENQEEVTGFIVKNQINIVFFMIDAVKADAQLKLIHALGELKTKTGQDVYFLHTSGAKQFSEFADFRGPVSDNDPDLYDKQTIAKYTGGPAEFLTLAGRTNCLVIEESEKRGINSFIFIPCIVYGRGRGFGNKISIQTVAIVKAALACKRVYKVDEGHPTWPVCHVDDTAELYIAILRAILEGQNPPHGKQGYYLASPGSIAWDDLYHGMAKRLLEKGVIDTDEVTLAGEKEVEQMAKGLACPPSMVSFQLGGQCYLAPKNGANVGWKAKYPAQQAIETSADEVDLILENL